MILIDFKKTARHTFKNGILKGMAAPVLMFGSFQIQKLPNVRKVEINSRNVNQSLSSDWNTVRSDLNAAVLKYGETKKA